MRHIVIVIAATVALGACAQVHEAGGELAGVVGTAFDPVTQRIFTPDATVYRQISVEALSKAVKDGAIASGEPIELTAPVDGRFARQIVIDLRLGQGQAASRRQGDCIQVLLPYNIDQKKFDSGRYIIRGEYHKAWLDTNGELMYENNRYEVACGDTYLLARTMEKAP